MTVCVAAFAVNGECIICLADKALSYGDYLQWDSDVTKIIPMNSGNGVMMVSGGENVDTPGILLMAFAPPCIVSRFVSPP
jgi:hypothetical protein